LFFLEDRSLWLAHFGSFASSTLHLPFLRQQQTKTAQGNLIEALIAAACKRQGRTFVKNVVQKLMQVIDKERLAR